MAELSGALGVDAIDLDVAATSKAEMLRHAAVILAGLTGADQASELTQRTGAIEALLLQRERVASTGVGEGVAVPHASTELLQQPKVALLRIAQPVDFDAVDGKPVSLVFAVLAPKNGPALHLRLLARVARLMRSGAVRQALLDAPTAEAARAIITRATAEQRDGRAAQASAPRLLAQGEV